MSKSSQKSVPTASDNRRMVLTTLGRLYKYAAQYKWRLVLIVICIVLSAVIQAAIALFLQTLVDRYILPMIGTSQASNWQPLIAALTIMACIFGVGVASTWLWNWLIIAVEQGVLKSIRDDMFAHQQLLAIRYFDTHGHGDIMSRYTNDASTLAQVLSRSFPEIFSSALSAVAALLAMAWISLPMTAFTILFTVALCLVVRLLLRHSSKHFYRQQQMLGDLNSFIEEAVSAQKAVKVFNHEQAMTQEFCKKNEELFDAAARANMYGNAIMPVVANLGYLLYLLLAIVGTVASLAGCPNLGIAFYGPFTLGTLISVLTLSRAFINPIGQVSMQLNLVMLALAGASRMFSFIDEPVESDEGSVSLVRAKRDDQGSDHAVIELQGSTRAQADEYCWAWKRQSDDDGVRSLQLADSLDSQAFEVAREAKQEAASSSDGRLTLLRGDIRFTNVTFGYEPDKPVLHDITWYAKPGQKIALVGATGAGKTTIANLINRFYDIQQGQILYDGIDIRDICKPDLRRSLGIVLQDVSLFTGTVMDNIRYGRLEASDEECIAAAKLTNADGFIRMLSDGYHTVLQADGGELSQGQRQLISIARAAVADPPVMILDEATSSIDTRTEEIVQQGMDALMRGRTVFVIAHRLSTVRNANVIMVLDHGRIIERGSHEELIARQGEYYQLYTGSLELS